MIDLSNTSYLNLKQKFLFYSFLFCFLLKLLSCNHIYHLYLRKKIHTRYFNMNECALSILLAIEALLNHIKDLCGIQASNIDVIIFSFTNQQMRIHVQS